MGPTQRPPVSGTQALPPWIRFMRGQRVILDSDLAELYGVETRLLNQAVRRNRGRFPDDFMCQLSAVELANLKSQNVISRSCVPWSTSNRSSQPTRSPGTRSEERQAGRVIRA